MPRLSSKSPLVADGLLRLAVTLQPKEATVVFAWSNADGPVARGIIRYDVEAIPFFALKYGLTGPGIAPHEDAGSLDASSIRARIKRWLTRFDCEAADVTVQGRALPRDAVVLTVLARDVSYFYSPLRKQLNRQRIEKASEYRLEVEIGQAAGNLVLTWLYRSDPSERAARLTVAPVSYRELEWKLEMGKESGTRRSLQTRDDIELELGRWIAAIPVTHQDVIMTLVRWDPKQARMVREPAGALSPQWSLLSHLVSIVEEMATALRVRFTEEGRLLAELPAEERARLLAADQVYRERQARHAQEQAAASAKVRQREELRKAEQARHRAEEKAAEAARVQIRAALQTAPSQPAVPEVPVEIALGPLDIAAGAQEPLPSLQRWLLEEKAALWWISNQSDDLLCLPHCSIQRLEFQVRTALRVLGALRGRALLSDEVGLGKTIEAGLVLKELFTRGLARRALILTVPSLVDQWREELENKFNLGAQTTNDPLLRSDPAAFWSAPAVVVASLHTLKQPAQLALARAAPWDALVVDEAHHLRKRESQAWQAVDALPRQFLLLLTATPVQNSIEELYNLVTLLQPGQLPSPQEFRKRFIDPKSPRQPREPDELRRLLGQVMIRNTRANAGIDLPPRRAETVLFEPAAGERAFHESWEAELRLQLAALPAGPAALWGRLLLQAAGSSPDAWVSALEKFPDATAARTWRAQGVFAESWARKCELLPALAKREGGCVIFSQFRATQAALERRLHAAGVPVVAVNGATPAAERQPLTERFRREGGALLLTRSGAEGRNLQFCHQLVNFDLPWNPMEIEQRIGRVHRLGQRHPVEIYNLVQRGSLQEHLLGILQEKLNLFELVVGETALILGERFSSDEFAEEILRRWRENEGRVAESLADLGDELAASRADYSEIKRLDETLFAHDFEST